jgi:hypothetical protein
MRLFTCVAVSLLTELVLAAYQHNNQNTESATPAPTFNAKEFAMVVAVSLVSTCIGCLALVAAMGFYAKWRKSRYEEILDRDEEAPTDRNALLNSTTNTSYYLDNDILQEPDKSVDVSKIELNISQEDISINVSTIDEDVFTEKDELCEPPMGLAEMPLRLNDRNVILDKQVNIKSCSELFQGTFDGSDVAVKKLAVDNEQVFEQEMNLLSTLSHPNIVPFMGSVKKDDHQFIMTKYVSNHSLDWHLTGNGAVLGSFNKRHIALPFQTKVKILLGVAKGMRYLHSKNLVHGNLKTSNVLVST